MCNGWSARQSLGGAVVILKPTRANKLSSIEELSLQLAEDGTTGRILATINNRGLEGIGGRVLIQYVNPIQFALSNAIWNND